MTKSLQAFMTEMAAYGGMSFSNGYDVDIEFPTSAAELKTKLTTDFPEWNKDEGILHIMCEEAQLPNVQAATGQLQGRYLGENQLHYSYARFFSDLSLTWMCDANMTPLKFFNAWTNYMFDGSGGETIQEAGSLRLKKLTGKGPLPLERTIRPQFPEKYLSNMRITKVEKGPSAPNERASIAYILQDCYPYSIDSVPLSYGTSQITKVTVNFYYAKHSIVNNNMKGYIGGSDSGIRNSIAQAAESAREALGLN
jgi:hypothetical protein